MKNIISTMLTMSSITMLSVMTFENVLQIVPRYKAGTIQKDVERIQTYVTSDGKTHVVVRKLDPIRYEKNMRAIRSHVTCVESPLLCGNEGSKFN